MPPLSSILLFMTAGLALNLTPGPDMLYVAARGSSEGRGAGIASALGIFVGCLVHIAALALGLSAILGQVPAAYDAVRFLGAGYLIYLGLRGLFRPKPLLAAEPLTRASRRAVFAQGVWTNVLNPKVALFFLAFLPQFLAPERGSTALQIVVLGMLFNTTGLIVNGSVAWLASGATAWLRRRPQAGTQLQRITGGIFVLLGLRLAMAVRR